ncbi:helix-turn-helix domain-containing protein [Micromonospora sp. NPDC049374]|uniref:helix-turn-helix domain-containing protein n=1 Tax=Micromonospora sp. NPDC049374 TaxID=3154352 RepID=UPI003434C0D3
MARAERPLDPTADPLQAFAADLRTLRDKAGRPTYQALARRAHRSASSLSEAAGGRRLPTLDTTLAYVRALGGDEAEWTERWRVVAGHVTAKQGHVDPTGDHDGGSETRPATVPPAAAGSGAATPVAAGPVAAPPAASAQDGQESLGPPTPAGATASSRPVGRTARAVLAGALVLTGLVAVPWLAGGFGEPEAGSTTSPAAEPTTVTVGVRDGADPKDAGCAADAEVTTLDSAAVLLDEGVIGTVELRYAPSCGASWPRFVPVPAAVEVPRPARIQLTVFDGDDAGRQADFAMDYAGISTFGNLLTSTRTCVWAQVQLSGQGWASPPARTGCWRGATQVRPIP